MIWAALSMGFLSNLHCVGMCGPLALALPMSTGAGYPRWIVAILYHVGRSFAYGMLGVLISVLGIGAQLVGWSPYLAIASGVMLLSFLVFPLFLIKVESSVMPKAWQGYVREQLRSLMQQKGLGYTFLFGFFNGLLPCGMVYAALVMAAAASQWYGSPLFMLAFGLGTMPILTFLSWTGKGLQSIGQKRLRTFYPYVVSITAALLILRGLQLGIPYVSPLAPTEECTSTNSCCTK